MNQPSSSIYLATSHPGYAFEPADDITVGELAAVLKSLLNVQGANFRKELVETLPDDCKRHFKSAEHLDAATLAYLESSAT